MTARMWGQRPSSFFAGLSGLAAYMLDEAAAFYMQQKMAEEEEEEGNIL